MVGGLMNLSSYGNENIILTGNPTKTMFKAVYHKYTNFGMQRFRLDYDGLRNLSFINDTELTFKVKRYGDLIGDTYVVVTLPDIYSPLFSENADMIHPTSGNQDVTPYQFRWIENLGFNMIRSITIKAGGGIIQEYPGEYLICLAQRDLDNTKRDLLNKMIGNIPELNDPARANGNVNEYPNSAVTGTNTDVNPSIQGRQLFIPIEAWFCGNSKLAAPLVAMQYQELEIDIVFRPVCELYIISDIEVADLVSPLGPRIAPNPNNIYHQFWRFIQPPPSELARTNEYTYRKMDWKVDIHLMANYYFLGNDERTLFAKSDHKYLIRNPYYHDFLNATGSRVIDIYSRDMVANYMWRFRRSDVNRRNQWSNYSNWAYDDVVPNGSRLWVPTTPTIDNFQNQLTSGEINQADPNENIRDILIDLGIVIGGQYREVVMQQGVYNLMEKYLRTTGNAKDGLYCYNFCLNSSQREYQPSGAMNMNKFKSVQFEYNTIEPPVDPNSAITTICDGDGNIIGVRKIILIYILTIMI